MQMIMFFVGSDASLDRPRKLVRSTVRQNERHIVRRVPSGELVHDAVLLTDRPMVRQTPRISIPDYVPPSSKRDSMEEEIERWDGLY